MQFEIHHFLLLFILSVSYLRSHYLIWDPKDFNLVSSKNFIVLALLFDFFPISVHFGWRSCLTSLFLCEDIQLFHHLLLKSLFFLHWIILNTCWKSIDCFEEHIHIVPFPPCKIALNFFVKLNIWNNFKKV
jgi:hypothetical protein